MRKVLDAPDVKEKLVAQGVEIANGTPAELSRLLNEDLSRWEKIVKQSGAKID
jgi:tripartite-type tricarboxylate transporter receptor subunit TctC